jgi:uncharacterized protein YgbK (DUF1537 family)
MRTVVLDDDPTGTQAASDVTMLLEWDVDTLTAVLRDEGSVYLQTNSRAIDAAQAVALARRIRGAIAEAERRLDERVQVVLRGDSTLRGHVFDEADVFLADGGSSVLFVPAFPDGGRVTVDGTHFVHVDGRRVPVAESEYAQDPVFGYRSSNLVDFVREKGRRKAIPVPLAVVRSTGGAAVTQALSSAGHGEFVVPDAENDADIALIHRGLTDAVRGGQDVVVRCASPLAAMCAGRASAGLLPSPLPVPAGPVLVVCGSHTHGATQQIQAVTGAFGWKHLVLPTEVALADTPAAIADAVTAAGEALRRDGVVIVASERERRPEHNTLQHGERVMAALVGTVRALADVVGVVVTKGGITSAEVTLRGLGVTRARVRGQVLPGVSVLDLRVTDDSGGGHDVAQVVVPGNVGGPGTLIDLGRRLGLST